jgi:hypothetical protein
LKEASSPGWEDKLEIESIFQDSLMGGLTCKVLWKDGDTTTHPAKWLYVKCPQKVYSFSLTSNPS